MKDLLVFSILLQKYTEPKQVDSNRTHPTLKQVKYF